MTVRMRALVIDDDIAIRVLVTRILQRHGFTVDAARDGGEGIEKLASAAYAVVVLDLMMPRVDGAGVLKYLAEYHPTQLATVIVISAFGASATEHISPSPERFLAKPFDVDELVREVNACVAAANRTPESAED